MYQIKELGLKDFAAWEPVNRGAYPGIDTTQAQRQAYFEGVADSGDAGYFGAYDGDELVGVYRYHDFTMNLFGRLIHVGGLGGVAVDLAHKKRHVCREMMEHFHRNMHEQGISLCCLFPFEPRFYRPMGYGLGTRAYRYSIDPAWIHQTSDAPRPSHARPEDGPAIMSFLNDRARHIHGMILWKENLRTQKNLFSLGRIALVRDGGRIVGYMRYNFVNIEEGNEFRYDLEVYAIHTTTPRAFLAFMTFLAHQKDQVRRVFINSPDDNLFAAFDNLGMPDQPNILEEYLPTAMMGVGMMYRILDLERLLEVTPARPVQARNGRLRLHLTDSFMPENTNAYTLVMEDGILSLGEGDAPVELRMDIADFASLFMGTFPLASLVRTGRAACEPMTGLEMAGNLLNVCVRPENYLIF